MADEKDDAKGVSRRGFLRGAGAGAVVVAGAGSWQMPWALNRKAARPRVAITTWW
ncbi:twin-arginine translocation signal domain-containing protein [Pseudomonas aeruginosa]|nr:twin-arginine translocation signal domain-containing protein [Pseudomonas aeruginosa]